MSECDCLYPLLKGSVALRNTSLGHSNACAFPPPRTQGTEVQSRISAFFSSLNSIDSLGHSSGQSRGPQSQSFNQNHTTGRTYTTMDTLFGITGKDFTITAYDSKAVASITLMKIGEDKSRELNPHTLMLFSGEPGDGVHFSEYIERNIKLYGIRNGIELSPRAVASFARRELADSLRSRVSRGVMDPLRLLLLLLLLTLFLLCRDRVDNKSVKEREKEREREVD